MYDKQVDDHDFNTWVSFFRQHVSTKTDSRSEEAVNDSFDFLQREGQEEVEEEIDDGGNADDELDDKEYEDRRVSAKKAKQGKVKVNLYHVSLLWWKNYLYHPYKTSLFLESISVLYLVANKLLARIFWQFFFLSKSPTI